MRKISLSIHVCNTFILFSFIYLSWHTNVENIGHKPRPTYDFKHKPTKNKASCLISDELVVVYFFIQLSKHKSLMGKLSSMEWQFVSRLIFVISGYIKTKCCGFHGYLLCVSRFNHTFSQSIFKRTENFAYINTVFDRIKNVIIFLHQKLKLFFFSLFISQREKHTWVLSLNEFTEKRQNFLFGCTVIFD